MKVLRVLVACEESQAVTKEFRALGHEAYSCDLLPCSGGHPEWHIEGDVTKMFNQQWDLVIAFPPCTDLTKACANLWPVKQQDGRQKKAFDFVKSIWDINCNHIAIENPVGWLNTNWMKPIQIFHPFHFGDPYKKQTCLWLNGLPKLEYTNVVEPTHNWHSGSIGYVKDGVRIRPKTKPMTFMDSKRRSKTFPGIAKAMATQWSEFLTQPK